MTIDPIIFVYLLQQQVEGKDLANTCLPVCSGCCFAAAVEHNSQCIILRLEGNDLANTCQMNRRQYEQYVCKRIPNKQAVVVMACDNMHMSDDMILEFGDTCYFLLISAKKWKEMIVPTRNGLLCRPRLGERAGPAPPVVEVSVDKELGSARFAGPA